VEQLVLESKRQNMKLGQYLIREGILKREQLVRYCPSRKASLTWTHRLFFKLLRMLV